MFVPEHTPLASVPTHCPLSVYCPAPHTIQSLDVGPVHVLHVGEHKVQLPPLLKLPSGHGLLEPMAAGAADVADAATHLVWSLASWVKPDLQDVQSPVPSEHCVHPSSQTRLYVSNLNRLI